MKKSDKLNILHDSKGTYNMCRCFFAYDPNYWYFYILDNSDKMFLGVEEDDFSLDGFQIRKISDLKKIESRDDLCKKINEKNQILSDLKKPKVDLTSWKNVFKSLEPLDIYMIVQNENIDRDGGFFHLGYVTEIRESSVLFSSVDAAGEWTENVVIPYSKITSVTFNDRYSKTWQEYLSKQD